MAMPVCDDPGTEAKLQQELANAPTALQVIAELVKVIRIGAEKQSALQGDMENIVTNSTDRRTVAQAIESGRKKLHNDLRLKDGDKLYPKAWSGEANEIPFIEFSRRVAQWLGYVDPDHRAGELVRKVTSGECKVNKEWLQECDLNLDNFDNINYELGAMLATVTEGTANATVTRMIQADPGNGFSAWQALCNTYCPKSTTDATISLIPLMHPKQAKDPEDIMNKLEDWALKVSEYEGQLKPIGDEHKAAALNMMMPAVIKRELLFGPTEFIGMMVKVESILTELIADNGIKPMDLGNAEEEERYNDEKGKGNGNIQEQLEWLCGMAKGWRPKGKGKGKSKGQERYRGKDNKGKSKGKGKGQGKGKGVETRHCYDCGEQGHIGRHCPWRRWPGANGLEEENSDEQEEDDDEEVQLAALFNDSKAEVEGIKETIEDIGVPEDDFIVPRRSNTMICVIKSCVKDPSGACGSIACQCGMQPRGSGSVWTHNQFEGLNYLAKDEDMEEAESELSNVNQAMADGSVWKNVTVVVDSGAGENVMPRAMFPSIPVQSTARSRAGRGFRGLGGEGIANYGQQVMTVKTQEGQVRRTTWQVADVKRPLMSAARMAQAGNELFLMKKGAYIWHEKTKETTRLRRRGNVYCLDLRVKVPMKKLGNESEDRMDIGAVDRSGFAWPDP